MGDIPIAHGAQEEQPRVDPFQLDQDLQPQVIGAAHLRAVPLAVPLTGEEICGVLLNQAQALPAFGILERADRRFAKYRHVAERGDVLAASRVLRDQMPECGVMRTNFAQVFVHSVLPVVLLLEC